jgi:PAS domain S-box-containing protein
MPQREGFWSSTVARVVLAAGLSAGSLLLGSALGAASGAVQLRPGMLFALTVAAAASLVLGFWPAAAAVATGVALDALLHPSGEEAGRWVAHLLIGIGLIGIGTAAHRLRQRAASTAGLLRSAEERFQFFVRQVKDYAIFSMDAGGRITSWNVGCRNVLGYEEAEFVGMQASELFPPEDKERGVPQKELEAAAREGTASDDRWMMAKGGRRFFADGITSAARDEQGRLVGFTKVMRDRTQEKVESAERERLLIETERINGELERFASIASHDLKEPLRGVAILANFIREDEGEKLGRETRERLERITELCSRLSGLADALLGYARTGAALRKGSVDLNEAARGAVNKLRESLAVERGEVVLAGRLPVVEGDAFLLERAIANLVSNGVKYNTSPVRRVEIGPERDGIYVRDNGVGIDPAHHGAIFELFRRLPGADRREGVGLGLAMVKKIMDLHNGSIELRSTPGEGSTFVLRFPVVLRAGEERERVTLVESGAAAGERAS